MFICQGVIASRKTIWILHKSHVASNAFPQHLKMGALFFLCCKRPSFQDYSILMLLFIDTVCAMGRNECVCMRVCCVILSRFECMGHLIKKWVEEQQWKEASHLSVLNTHNTQLCLVKHSIQWVIQLSPCCYGKYWYHSSFDKLATCRWH